jgi:transcriptional regulator with XRE-family HTH domain
MGNTNSAGTPFFDRVSQYQTCDCVVPIRSAKGFCPPANLHARLSAASVLMTPPYPFLGGTQPKNLWGTNYRDFGRFRRMKDGPDAKEFGRRVRELREERGLSQGELGAITGDSQTNIGWVESGGPKDPRKQALKFADALQTTSDWLLYGKGQKSVGVVPLSPAQFLKVYEEMDQSARRVLSEMVRHHMDQVITEFPKRRSK